MKKVIRFVCGAAAMIGLIMAFGECETMGGTIIVKAVALALLVAGTKGYDKTMTPEEKEEKA
jgi:hypothetical protein